MSVLLCGVGLRSGRLRPLGIPFLTGTKRDPMEVFILQANGFAGRIG